MKKLLENWNNFVSENRDEANARVAHYANIMQKVEDYATEMLGGDWYMDEDSWDRIEVPINDDPAEFKRWVESLQAFFKSNMLNLDDVGVEILPFGKLDIPDAS